MSNLLADLNQLVSFGFLEKEVTVQVSKDTVYLFVLKTLHYLDEIEAQTASTARTSKFMKERQVDESSRNETQVFFKAVEVLARSIQSINGVNFDSIFNIVEKEALLKAKGDKLSTFNDKLLAQLWTEYQNLKESVYEVAQEEESNLKK